MKKLITSLCLAMLGVSAQAAWPTGESAATIAAKLDAGLYKPDKTWCNTNPRTVYPYTTVVLRTIYISWVEPTARNPGGELHSCSAYIFD